jgi:hypothetical protein
MWQNKTTKNNPVETIKVKTKKGEGERNTWQMNSSKWLLEGKRVMGTYRFMALCFFTWHVWNCHRSLIIPDVMEVTTSTTFSATHRYNSNTEVIKQLQYCN